MAVATISALSAPASEATSTNNLAFSLTTTTLGKLVVVFAVSRDTGAIVNYATLSSSNVNEWNSVGTFPFAAQGSIAAQVITVFVGIVTTVSTATVTATPSASMASIAGGFSWREVTTSALTVNTSWVVETISSLRNTGSSTDLPLPTLVPAGANRAYIGYCDPNGTATPTGVTAGYTALPTGSGDSMGNQWVTNLSVSTSQSPVGKQTVAGVSDTVGLLLRAYEADTSVATNLNIGAGAGKNHFKLQTAFLGYDADTEKLQAQIVAGWNTDPQFRANADGSVTLSVAAGAPTTGGTNYPRSELAELATDGVTDLAWNANVGIHWIRGRTRIGTLGPNRPHATLFQLHDGRGGFPSLVGEVIQISAQVDSGVHQLRLRLWDTTVSIPPLHRSADAGDVLDWMCYINAGYWAFYYQDLGTPIYDSNNFAADGHTDTFTGNAEYYFKCGMYPQTNELTPAFEDPAAIQSADLMFLQHWHTGWPTPSPATITLPKTAQFAPMFG